MEGILRALRYTSLIFALQKKSTDSKTNGLPSVALAKDGGGEGSWTPVLVNTKADIYMFSWGLFAFRRFQVAAQRSLEVDYSFL